MQKTAGPELRKLASSLWSSPRLSNKRGALRHPPQRQHEGTNMTGRTRHARGHPRHIPANGGLPDRPFHGPAAAIGGKSRRACLKLAPLHVLGLLAQARSGLGGVRTIPSLARTLPFPKSSSSAQVVLQSKSPFQQAAKAKPSPTKAPSFNPQPTEPWSSPTCTARPSSSPSWTCG
jgi:hypothetical protein